MLLFHKDYVSSRFYFMEAEADYVKLFYTLAFVAVSIFTIAAVRHEMCDKYFCVL